jgi:hypothetical protein
MKYPWHEMKNRIQNSILLSAAAMFCSLPLFQYQYLHLSSKIFPNMPSPEKIYYLAVSQSFILFALALLCSLIGFLYSDPLNMPGFGKLSDAAVWLPVGLMIGIVFTPIRYFLFDRSIIMTIPELFPKPWGWALAQMIGTTIPQEVIVRFGLLTIGVYLLRKLNYSGHPVSAIGLISVFGSFVTYLTMIRFNIASKLIPNQMITLLLLTFCLQWIYCEIYIRKGLVATVCIHFGLTVKFLLYALIF